MNDKAQYIIVINCGSSSLKWSLFNVISKQHCIKGLVEAIGTDSIKGSATSYLENQKIKITLNGNKFFHAISSIKEALEHFDVDIDTVVGVGHRVVHGGEIFSDAVVVNPQVLKDIESLSALAPLHNPANLVGLEFAQEIFPNILHVAVFDTSFHQTIRKSDYLYPVSYELYEKYKVRRYGFHGTSHDYVYHRLAKFLERSTEDFYVITAHLGNGCSICAVENGKSRQTTMGLTPLDGTMMGTRSGSVDPGIFDYLYRTLNINISEITEILNKKSGILGISGFSNDLRDVEEKADLGDCRSKLALEMFSKSIAGSIMHLSIYLPRLDAIIFTGGIGENSTVVQKMVIENLHHLNTGSIKDLDPRIEEIIRLNHDNGLPIYKVATDEEQHIALQTLDKVGSSL